MPDPISIDPNSPSYDDLDAAATALAALFPNSGSETAGMLYKAGDGKFRYSTTVPGKDDSFVLRALVPQGASLAAIAHSHPGKDAQYQYFSPNDIRTADQLKLPSYVRFLDANDTRVYRPGVTKTQHMAVPEGRITQVVARGDPVTLAKIAIAQQLAPAATVPETP